MNLKNISQTYYVVYAYFLVLTFYSVFNVGFISEMFAIRADVENISVNEYLKGVFKTKSAHRLNPIGYLLDYGYALFLSNNLIYISIYKFLIVCTSSVLINFFLKNFVDKHISIILTFTIIFLPNADSLIYSSAHRYTLSIGLALFSYNFAINKKYNYVFFYGILSLLTCYVSIIIICALTIFFIIKKNINIFLTYFLIILLFFIFYFSIRITSEIPINRLDQSFDLLILFKKFLLTYLSIFDSTVGISFFLKFVGNIYSNIYVFIIIFLINIFIFRKIFLNKKIGQHNIQDDKFMNLILISAVILITASFVFSLTQRYPFVAFGLGNRLSIFANLLLVSTLYLLLYKNKIGKNLLVIFISMVIASGVSVSSHWKIFSNETYTFKTTISKICHEAPFTNNNLSNDFIFIDNMRYSSLLSFDHIDFISSFWVTEALCKNEKLIILPVSNQIELKESNIKWKKFNKKYTFDKDLSNIYIFDDTRNEIKKIELDKLSMLLRSQRDNRHWVLKISFLTDMIRNLSNNVYK